MEHAIKHGLSGEQKAPIEERTEAPSVRAAVLRLVRERRYEEALGVLYAARAESPKDKELSASIQQIKEFLAGAYAKRLGGLDRIAGPIPLSAGRSPDAMLVARYIDGSSTFDDISRTCPLGRLRTLEVLVELYSARHEDAPESELVVSKLQRAEAAAAPSPSAAETEPAPTTQRARVAVVVPAAPVRVETVGPPSSAPERANDAPAPPSSPEDIAFREAFARGTAAFVQRRFDDAADAFRECERLRPDDVGARTMLRRSLASGRS